MLFLVDLGGLGSDSGGDRDEGGPFLGLLLLWLLWLLLLLGGIIAIDFTGVISTGTDTTSRLVLGGGRSGTNKGCRWRCCRRFRFSCLLDLVLATVVVFLFLQQQQQPLLLLLGPFLFLAFLLLLDLLLAGDGTVGDANEGGGGD